MLSAAEATRLARGLELKRYVRAGAALRGYFDDAAIADAVGRSRNAVAAWWHGAVPEPDAVKQLADVAGIEPESLLRFLYLDGSAPTLIPPASVPLDDPRVRAAREFEQSSTSPARRPKSAAG